MRGQERVVRGDEHAPPALRLLEQPRGERGLAIGVDPARRLVEDEQIRLGHRDGGDAEPLALAAREIARMTARREREPERLERRRGAILVAAHAERDLFDRGLADEIAAGILGEVRRSTLASTVPCVGSSSPAAIFASVVLPLPLAPSSATISPR